MTDDALPEEKLAMLLGLLPPAPEAWTAAARALPAARALIDTLVERAEQDADFREGIEPSPALQRELARRLARPD